MNPLLPLLPTLALLSAVPAPMPGKPVPPGQAASRMTLPEGFRATLFAGEPDLVQPIAFAIDDRGRIWVAECFSYPRWRNDGKGRDRIVIFEDRNGDGHFTARKVFYDKIANISGIQLGFGGVWVCATPNLLFIPDRNGDDIPDGPPEVVLDGWDLKAKHNVFNSLTWGPDGWLYGCNGILSQSQVGKPGTPRDKRVPINCGVWRYHPTRQIFEAVAHGTTNPWGLDFDDYGQLFITNCVIHHLWHVIPGSHFQRMFGQDFNSHLYDLMASCADHIHWGGGPWQESRTGKGIHDQPGGGHAHVGAMVYLGDNWPDRYRNGVFMCNIHGNRVNHDILERKGSGYVAHHGKDFLFANDPWFRGITIQYGPDGGVFVSDWTDTGECHNYEIVDQTNGRIFKVTYGQPVPWHGDLASLSDDQLVKLQLHKNDWHVSHARRLLQERAAAGRLSAETQPALVQMLTSNPDTRRRLRALWALHGIGGLNEEWTLKLLDSPDEYIRAWAIQLQLEDRKPSRALLARLTELAAHDSSPFVRLYLTSGLQRLNATEKWPLAQALLAHAEDAADANLPLMIWYGIESLADLDRNRFVALILGARIPLLREFMARRVAEQTSGLESLVQLLARTDDATAQRDILQGMHEALKGQRHVQMPRSWPRGYGKLVQSSDADAREMAMFLAVMFDDAHAIASLRKLVLDSAGSTLARHSALQALLYKKSPDLLSVLQSLLKDRKLRQAAIRGLAAYSDAASPALILDRYGSLPAEEKADAIQTLASRPAYARALLDAVEKGVVPRRDLSAFTVRQIQALHDKQLNEQLARAWGVIRPASQEKATLMARYKSLLTPEYLKNADQGHGRAIFARTCAACHVLFGEGGKIGPELTGSQRVNLDYILDNVLDPSAVVPQDYQVTLLQTRDGRLITGIIKQENDKVLTVQTQNEVILVPKPDIEERAKSPLSMMPEGLLTTLTNEEVRDLVSYLASPGQVPLTPNKARPN